VKVQTLRWLDGQLEMIDQRILPAEFRYIGFDSACAVAEGIKSMVVRGAPAIGVAAAYGVALEALRLIGEPLNSFTQGLELGFKKLSESRPTAVNLSWALSRDRVAANGDVANKIGTYTLAVLAQRHAIPFYVAVPLSTIDRRALKVGLVFL